MEQLVPELAVKALVVAVLPVDTVMRGGDTDINAAICGALLGAVYGFDAIPANGSTVC